MRNRRKGKKTDLAAIPTLSRVSVALRRVDSIVPRLKSSPRQLRVEASRVVELDEVLFAFAEMARFVFSASRAIGNYDGVDDAGGRGQRAEEEGDGGTICQGSGGPEVGREGEGGRRGLRKSSFVKGLRVQWCRSRRG